ncbi:hypothetical protein M8C21_028629 [Ambrosia artemisiifolia]|uniref:Uncharacterized protein n=1 Tax=Ambrosia artemisiifolia TaxID=4212 RepID=A0AAD5C2S6_AMBAR|nr:hypothetical protein M8C21_028629 [Ambrosia artemisiifolia]
MKYYGGVIVCPVHIHFIGFMEDELLDEQFKRLDWSIRAEFFLDAIVGSYSVRVKHKQMDRRDTSGFVSGGAMYSVYVDS